MVISSDHNLVSLDLAWEKKEVSSRTGRKKERKVEVARWSRGKFRYRYSE